jgi:hypothetical protein
MALKKSIYLLITVVLICFHKIYAQKLNLVWGAELSTQARTDIVTIYRNSNDEIIILRKHPKTLFRSEYWQLDKFSGVDLRLVQSKQLVNIVTYKNTIALGFANNIILSSIKDNLQKKEFIFQVISHTGSITQTIYADTITTDYFKKRFIVTDVNKKYLLHTTAFEKEAQLLFKLKTYDSSYATVYNKTILSNIPAKGAIIKSVILAEPDLAYILISHSPRSESIFSYDIYKHSLLACDLKSGLFKEFELTLPDKNITDIGIKLSLNNRLIVSGFYSNKANSLDNVAGVFYLSIDNHTLNINGKGLKELPPELLRQFMSERKIRKGKELSGFSINHLIINNDGGSILLAEQSFINQVCNTDFRTGLVYCNDYYNYNDIIAIRISPKGEIDWTSRIGKRQLSINDDGYFSSYFPFVINDGIYLIYNDSPKNIGYNFIDPYTISNYRRSVAVKVFLKNNGEVTPPTPLENSKQNIIIRPKSFFMLDNGEGILIGKKRGNDIIGKIFITQ